MGYFTVACPSLWALGMADYQPITRILHSVGHAWFDFKSGLETLGIIQDQSIHILAGAFLQLAFAALLRRSIRSFLPLAAVLGLELANEWADLQFSTWPGRDAPYGEGAVDLVLTMALPTVLMILSRFHPRLLTE